MNYSNFVVKLVKNPIQVFFNETNYVTRLVAQIPQESENSVSAIVNISIWGKLGTNFLDYCKVNDYFIVEGYITLNSIENLEEVNISVAKIYPFF